MGLSDGVELKLLREFVDLGNDCSVTYSFTIRNKFSCTISKENRSIRGYGVTKHAAILDCMWYVTQSGFLLPGQKLKEFRNGD